MGRVNFTRRNFSIGAALVIIVLVVALGVSVMALRPLRSGLAEWPPFTMIYQAPGAAVSVGNKPFRVIEVRRLEYQSKTEWTETVIEATPIETSYGTFSDVGSYRELSGGVFKEFDAVTDSTRTDTVEAGVTRIPNSYLRPIPLQHYKESEGVTVSYTTTDATVCFEGDDCTENAMGIAFTKDGRTGVYADDSRGIPLKMGDDFIVRELRIDDERSPFDIDDDER